MNRFDYYDFELATLQPDDPIVSVCLASQVNTEALKVLIQRQYQLFKRIQEVEKKIKNMEEETK